MLPSPSQQIKPSLRRGALRLTGDVMRGTIRKLGIEGSLWALISDSGETVELLDCPKALQKNGIKAEVELDRTAADVSVGMVGDVAAVRSFRVLSE